MKEKENANGKGKGRAKGCAVALVLIAALLVFGGGIGWALLSQEHREAANVSLEANFDMLNDGIYYGVYRGGTYKWRKNECVVTVRDGKVTDIQLMGSDDPGGENTQHQVLYDRVIAAQSLQVDTISGATLTSKAYLKAVENALLQAQRE